VMHATETADAMACKINVLKMAWLMSHQTWTRLNGGIFFA
jgi:hypothetical protein